MNNNDIIKSDLEYVKMHTDNIKRNIEKSIEYCQESHAVDSTVDNNYIYTSINDIVKSYCDAEIELMGKAKHEVDFMLETALKYAILDQKLKEKVESISDNTIMKVDDQ